MAKKSQKKKQDSKAKINIGGDITGDRIVIGNNNIINFQEAIKSAYGLFTIPAPIADFTGRTNELEKLKTSFKDGAIITGVSGGGGVGKTELARKLAGEVADEYPNARMSMDLLGTSENPLAPEEAMRRLLEPLYPNQKLPDESAQLKGLYQQTFAAQKALILLDNAKDENQVRPLIPPKPSAAIITSRKHFSLTEFGLNPLRLDVLSPVESRDLLRKTSLKLREISDGELDTLAKLCGHLPLALRVAASLLNDRDDWTITTLQKRLEDEQTRLKRLKRDGDPDLDVEATLSLSYNLLDENLKQKFRQLGVFTAPFICISAQAVWELEDEADADDLLGLFTNLSLLNISTSTANLVARVAESDTNGILRPIGEVLYSYVLHDLTSIFATSRLVENEEEAKAAIMRHANHFLGWSNTSEYLYKKGKENVLLGLNNFRFIWVHLQAAYERLLPDNKTFFHSPEADRWLSIFPGVCGNVLKLHLRPNQNISLIETALKASQRLGDRSTEATHFGNLGNAYRMLGDAHKALEFYEKTLAIVQEISDRHLEGIVLGNLGVTYKNLGNVNKAIEFYEQALVIAREINDLGGESDALCNLGSASLVLDEANKAIKFYEQALVIAREINDLGGEGGILSNLGNAYYRLGDVHKAIKFYEQALTIAHEVVDPHTAGSIIGNLGNAYYRLGDVHKAIEYYEKALVIMQEIGDQRTVGFILSDLGSTYKNLGDVHKAIEFFEKTLVILQEIGDRRGESDILGKLGSTYATLGDARKAIEFFEKALVILQEIGDRRGEGNTLGKLGSTYATLGDARKAIEFFEKALVILQEIGDRRGEGNTLGNLGSAYVALGEKEKARGVWEQALLIFRAIESPHVKTIENCLANLDGNGQTEQRQEMPVDDFIRMVLEVKRTKHPKGEQLFGNLSKMAIDANQPPEIQSLAKVLRDVMAGINNPDLSKLPEGLAKVVQEELEKKE